MSKPKLGILGLGSIGRAVAGHVFDGQLGYELAGVCDNNPDSARDFLQSHSATVELMDLARLMQSCDVVVEAAAAEAVPEFVQLARQSYAANRRPADLLVMSVGGLLQIDLEEYRTAADAPVLHVPAGAIGGLEALQAMGIAGLDEVRLTTRKPPGGLGQEVSGETLLFEGSAAEVFELYPRNVNVAIALSLAGIGPQRTQVRLLADPAVTRNTHTIYARGAAGELNFTSQNEPFPDNPKTSYLAALSAIALLRRIGSRVQVG